ncbi:MAG: AIPR family protein [Dysgonamonadaceae bacterium]|jgi:hypothetical protein|nr:AIPR family protein [Dysgonamonadaceae bacterium]MDR2058087.1 AIPR family protein [Dysgonamonadaceae bacterium]
MIYETIKEQIKQDYFQQNYPNDGQRFVAWYLRNIHLRDMNETKDDITDGADDKQIDAIVIDNDKSTIYIIQGKFYSGNTVDAEPLRETFSSWVQLQDLEKLQIVGNDKLKRKLSEIAQALDDDYEICFELVTTSKLTDAAQKDLETFQIELAKLSENKDWNATISLIDENELERRYELALEKDNPSINYTLDLSDSKFLIETIAGTQVVLAAVPLKDCIKFPGIKDGSLFQKNVRQSLGTSNAVNKGIRQTILSDKHKDFFFFHNGITAICNKMEISDKQLTMHGLSVVNGCQSLNTILSCSEAIKKQEDTFVMFRFYEIPQHERADRISINTNSQSAVKPRDLRSNDKRVLNLKRTFELKYPNGCFLTKRGEQAPANKDKNQVIDLSDLGKYLIAWHSQRPNISYGETKIFDKYFEILFDKKRDYNPENVQALNFWMQEIKKVWINENPLGFNETLLVMKAYAPYHQLYAISMCFAISNNMADRVPSPSSCIKNAKEFGLIEELIKISGLSLNLALEAAANEPQPLNRVFSPQNWIKAKTCLAGINFAIRNYFNMLPMLPGGQEVSKKLKEGLLLGQECFEYRWAAD